MDKSLLQAQLRGKSFSLFYILYSKYLKLIKFPLKSIQNGFSSFDYQLQLLIQHFSISIH